MGLIPAPQHQEPRVAHFPSQDWISLPQFCLDGLNWVKERMELGELGTLEHRELYLIAKSGDTGE